VFHERPKFQKRLHKELALELRLVQKHKLKHQMVQ
jgi:hypothetical protein